MGKKRIIQQTKEELLKEVAEGKHSSSIQARRSRAKGEDESKALIDLATAREKEKVESATKKEVKETLKKVKEGRIYIFSSYNNTIITLTDLKGNVLGWVSAGSIGFKGTKKATPFAASKAAEAIAQIVQKIGIEKIEVLVKGIGSGRESAIRSLVARGLYVVSIKDITPIPHNGCRPPKVRRV